jgi:hypothetical protein
LPRDRRIIEIYRREASPSAKATGMPARKEARIVSQKLDRIFFIAKRRAPPDHGLRRSFQAPC